MMEIERYINFITKHKLTQSQFLFLILIKKQRWDLIRKYKEAFPSEDGLFIGKVLRDDLVSRGFIIPINDEEKANSYKIGRKFLEIFVDPFEATRELKEAYPAYMVNDGKKYPLKHVDVYEVAGTYAERIHHELAEHEEILVDLKYGIENNLIKVKLDKFIKSEAWIDLRKERKGQNVNVESHEIDG